MHCTRMRNFSRQTTGKSRPARWTLPSFPRDVLLQMCEQQRITVLDHHESARDALADLAHTNLNILFDMEKSGARLTWEYFHSEPAPWLVQYVEARFESD